MQIPGGMTLELKLDPSNTDSSYVQLRTIIGPPIQQIRGISVKDKDVGTIVKAALDELLS